MTVVDKIPAVYYPPYGRMPVAWEEDLKGPGAKPGNWRKDVDWEGWTDAMSNLLSHVLWPRYNQIEARWVGRARHHMHALTLQDFDLLVALREVFKTDAKLKSGPVSQASLFVIEDTATLTDEATHTKIERGPPVSLKKYLTDVVPASTVDDIVKAFRVGLSAAAGDLDLNIKTRMQRPRAYQMAFRLGLSEFSHEFAAAAQSPSMVSGHCLETVLGGAALMYDLDDMSLLSEASAPVAQFTVDVGDRRVFGGVHYPSDNISSWLTGLLACPIVFKDDRAATWLWDAIQNRSVVYQAIKRTIDDDSESPYAAALSLLGSIGARDIKTIEAALEAVSYDPDEGG